MWFDFQKQNNPPAGGLFCFRQTTRSVANAENLASHISGWKYLMPEKLGEALLELGTDDRKPRCGLGRAESLTLKTVNRLKTTFAGNLTVATVAGYP